MSKRNKRFEPTPNAIDQYEQIYCPHFKGSIWVRKDRKTKRLDMSPLFGAKTSSIVGILASK